MIKKIYKNRNSNFSGTQKTRIKKFQSRTRTRIKFGYPIPNPKYKIPEPELLLTPIHWGLLKITFRKSELLFDF